MGLGLVTFYPTDPDLLNMGQAEYAIKSQKS